MHNNAEAAQMNRTDETCAQFFLRNEHPSMSLALPPVGWHSTDAHDPQMTTVCACEKTVVILKQPGHLTSIKKDRGPCTSCLSLCFCASEAGVGFSKSTERTLFRISVYALRRKYTRCTYIVSRVLAVYCLDAVRSLARRRRFVGERRNLKLAVAKVRVTPNCTELLLERTHPFFGCPTLDSLLAHEIYI